MRRHSAARGTSPSRTRSSICRSRIGARRSPRRRTPGCILHAADLQVEPAAQSARRGRRGRTCSRPVRSSRRWRPTGSERAVTVGFALGGARVAAGAHAGRRRPTGLATDAGVAVVVLPAAAPFGQLGPAYHLVVRPPASSRPPASAGPSSKRIDPLQASATTAAAASAIEAGFTPTALSLHVIRSAAAARRARCRSAGPSGSGRSADRASGSPRPVAAASRGERRGEEIVLLGQRRRVRRAVAARAAARCRAPRRMRGVAAWPAARARERPAPGRRTGRPDRSRREADLAARESDHDHALLHHHLGADEGRAAPTAPTPPRPRSAFPSPPPPRRRSRR